MAKAYKYENKTGVTQKCLAAVAKVVPQLGAIRYIRGVALLRKNGGESLVVELEGDKGLASFEGLGWGYGGEGPRGLEKLLRAIGGTDEDVEKIYKAVWPMGRMATDKDPRYVIWSMDWTVKSENAVLNGLSKANNFDAKAWKASLR